MMNSNKNTAFFLLLGFTLFAVSCDRYRVYEENIKIKDGIWNVHDTVFFNVDIADTVSPVNMYINVRIAGMYQFENLYMFVTTWFPNGKSQRDTVECILADTRGWLGNGLGDIWDNQILYRRRVQFPMTGKYIFAYEQAQRFGDKAFIENLPFIMDLGLRIEKDK